MTRRDDDDDLEGFDGLRSMIATARASGFDEEPAPRIDALLLAAARQHAPRPRVAWWARLADWMRPVVAHPALAGAAALVIVAGAAGVLYTRGERPTVVQPAATGGEPVARAPEVTADLPPPPPPAVPAGTTAADDTRTPPPEDVLAANGEPTDGAKRGAVRRERAEGQGAGRGDSIAAPQSTAKKSSAEVAPGGGGTALMIAEGPSGPGVIGDGAGAGADQGDDDFTVTLSGDSAENEVAVVEEKAPVAAGKNKGEDRVTTAPPPPIDDRPRPRPPTATATADAARDQATPRAQAEQLLRQAQTAARAGNCAAVKVTATRVKQLDATYFRDVFARDPDVTKCL